MYDMPVDTAEKRRSYTRFRKFLIRNGYVAMQKSVYVKLLRTITRVNIEMNMVRNAAPKMGTINIPPMTINGFKYLVSVGEHSFDMKFFSDDIIVI